VSDSGAPDQGSDSDSESGPGLTPPVDPERDHVRGPADAAVTLVQYGDFDCPSCGDMHPVVERLQDRLGNELHFVFRHFPLTQTHRNADRAARAAEAAASQGSFWAMHDTLYENQDALGRSDLVAHADRLGLDTDRFERDLEDEAYEERIHEDFSSGARSGVNGTPTFFVNGERYDGPLEFDGLLMALADAAGVPEAQSMRRDNLELRDTIDRSYRGAPAAGKTLRDSFSADEIFQRITATADEEFTKSDRLLFMSGIAAGMCITLSFIARSAVSATVPGEFAPVIANLFYPVGFVFIVLGRYQLFTENTLTPVTLVLTRIASVPRLLRVWGVVLAANLVGVAIGAYMLARTGVFTPEAAQAAHGFGEHALSVAPADLFFKAVVAGALVAGMVWLVHAARETTARFLIVVFLMFLIPSADLFHCIIGAGEVLYLVFQGDAGLVAVTTRFFLPVVLGNTVGGVVLVGILNYSHTEDRRFPDRDSRQLELSWSEWLFGQHRGQPRASHLTDREDRDEREDAPAPTDPASDD